MTDFVFNENDYSFIKYHMNWNERKITDFSVKSKVIEPLVLSIYSKLLYISKDKPYIGINQLDSWNITIDISILHKVLNMAENGVSLLNFLTSRHFLVKHDIKNFFLPLL